MFELLPTEWINSLESWELHGVPGSIWTLRSSKFLHVKSKFPSLKVQSVPAAFSWVHVPPQTLILILTTLIKGFFFCYIVRVSHLNLLLHCFLIENTIDLTQVLHRLCDVSDADDYKCRPVDELALRCSDVGYILSAHVQMHTLPQRHMHTHTHTNILDLI